MSPGAVHTVLLYELTSASLVAIAASLRGKSDPGPSAREVLKGIWPFAVLVVIEALSLCANGKLLFEWYLPGAATAVAMLLSRSSLAIRWTRQCRLPAHPLSVTEPVSRPRPTANLATTN
jgi:hypothetical protein